MRYSIIPYLRTVPWRFAGQPTERRKLQKEVAERGVQYGKKKCTRIRSTVPEIVAVQGSDGCIVRLVEEEIVADCRRGAWKARFTVVKPNAQRGRT